MRRFVLSAVLLLAVGCSRPAEVEAPSSLATFYTGTTKDFNRKAILLSALLLLAVGCTPAPKIEPIEDLEKKLAFVDNGRQPADETPYIQLLDNLQTYCSEDRQYIAMMASEMVDNEAEAGYSATILEMLQMLNEEASAGYEGRRVQCFNYFMYHAQSLKEASE